MRFICFITFLVLPLLLQAQNSCSQLPPAGSASALYKAGNKLCWNGKPVVLIGYGTTDLATRDGFDYSRYLNTIRYVPNSIATQRHGVNFTRVWATGTSNNPDCYHTPAAQDPARPPMTMPFRYLSGESCTAQNPFPKYNMCISDIACPKPAGLNQSYKTRLRDILRESRNNGIIVDLVLFDGFFLGKRDDRDFSPLYARNPWNPLHNNLDTKKFRTAPGSKLLTACKEIARSKSLSDVHTEPFPEFYEICSNHSSTPACDATLNCLGLIQKAYVQSMVDLVKNNRGASDHVIFEIMNRIRFDRNDPAFDLDQLKRWHDVVGYWVKCRSDGDCRSSKGDYLVSAVVGIADYADLSCTNRANCKNNPFDIFKMPNIDIVNLPARSWNQTPGAPGPCLAAKVALKKYQKPVVIDTDGTPEERADKCQVKSWAEEVASCTINGSPNSGRVHFDQLDGMTFGNNVAKKCSFTGGGLPVNPDFDEKFLDCHTLDTIGDAGPTYLSNIVTTPAPASCPHSVNSQGIPIWCADSCL